MLTQSQDLWSVKVTWVRKEVTWIRKVMTRGGSGGSGGVVGVGQPNRVGPSRGICMRCRGIPGMKKGGG